jgi:hypothetical protein
MISCTTDKRTLPADIGSNEKPWVKKKNCERRMPKRYMIDMKILFARKLYEE